MSAVWDPAKTMLFDAVSGKKDAKTAAKRRCNIDQRNNQTKIW